ncbi:ribonuclease P protein component [Desulfoscipio gibsoniae]|uniref:Ribonuclease P protein component n=1 Tax=Desulfoscipio gibsoniae DSM 7213 TaxID=767817 RepID=R4KWG8_9FIRM|nr:ribonuclease P protein component [Desulfoscipio gibsoniae]AGL03981.1 RNase P protein component [Desulfoscipio gibsoniae DSM 7213]
MQKKYLIKKNSDYRKVYNKGISLSNRYTVIFVYKNNLNLKRLGFSVSKKIGKAVRRNFVRRRMKEICRLNKDWFLNGYDYIFIARKGIDEISYKALKNGMEKLAYRISKHITRET